MRRGFFAWGGPSAVRELTRAIGGGWMDGKSNRSGPCTKVDTGHAAVTRSASQIPVENSVIWLAAEKQRCAPPGRRKPVLLRPVPPRVRADGLYRLASREDPKGFKKRSVSGPERDLAACRAKPPAICDDHTGAGSRDCPSQTEGEAFAAPESFRTSSISELAPARLQGLGRRAVGKGRGGVCG